MRPGASTLSITILLAVLAGSGGCGTSQVLVHPAANPQNLRAIAPVQTSQFPHFAAHISTGSAVQSTKLLVIAEDAASQGLENITTTCWTNDKQSPLLAAVVLANDSQLNRGAGSHELASIFDAMARSWTGMAKLDLTAWAPVADQEHDAQVKCIIPFGMPQAKASSSLVAIEPSRRVPLLDTVAKALESLNARRTEGRTIEPASVLVIVAANWFPGDDHASQADDIIARAKELNVAVYGLAIARPGQVRNSQPSLPLLLSLAAKTGGQVVEVTAGRDQDLVGAAGQLASLVQSREMGSRYAVSWEDKRLGLSTTRGYRIVLDQAGTPTSVTVSASIPVALIDAFETRTYQAAIDRSPKDAIKQLEAADPELKRQLLRDLWDNAVKVLVDKDPASAAEAIGHKDKSLSRDQTKAMYDQALLNLAKAQEQASDLPAAEATLKKHRDAFAQRNHLLALWRRWSDQHAEKKEYEKAIKILDNMAGRPTDLPEEDRQRYARLYADWAASLKPGTEANLRDVLAKFEKALEYDSAHAPATQGRQQTRLALAKLALEAKRYDEAVAFIASQTTPEATAVRISAMIGKADQLMPADPAQPAAERATQLLKAQAAFQQIKKPAADAKLDEAVKQIDQKLADIQDNMVKLAEAGDDKVWDILKDALKDVMEAVVQRARQDHQAGRHSPAAQAFARVDKTNANLLKPDDLLQWARSELLTANPSAALPLLQRACDLSPELLTEVQATEIIQAASAEAIVLELRLLLMESAQMEPEVLTKRINDVLFRSRVDCPCILQYGPAGNMERCTRLERLTPEMKSHLDSWITAGLPQQAITIASFKTKDQPLLALGVRFLDRSFVVLPEHRVRVQQQTQALANLRKKPTSAGRRAGWAGLVRTIREEQARVLADTLIDYVLGAADADREQRLTVLKAELERCGPFLYLLCSRGAGAGAKPLVSFVRAGEPAIIVPPDPQLAGITYGTFRDRKINGINVREQVREHRADGPQTLLRLGIVLGSE